MSRRILLIAMFALLTACTRVQPIHNINDQAVATGSGKTPTAAEVRSAIVQAAAEKTWQVKQVDATHLEATLHVRDHMAKVIIKYSPESYSINYESSEDLLKKGDKIHRRYNDWVRGLSITINKNLAKL